MATQTTQTYSVKMQNANAIRAERMRNAWKVAKTLGLKRLTSACFIKNTAPTWEWQVSEREEQFFAALNEGGVWNGTIYTKKQGKHNYAHLVYVDGVCYCLQTAFITESKQYQAELQAKISFYVQAPAKKQKTSTTTWYLANGKEIKNNLSWAEMFEMYGTDFE